MLASARFTGPPKIKSRQRALAPIGSAQARIAARGSLTTSEVTATPSILRATKISTAAAIATPRPWRVVRASPSAAKPISQAAKA